MTDDATSREKVPEMTETYKKSIEAELKGPRDGQAMKKKPYVPPRVVSHDALEVITGACTPSPPAKQSAATCSLSQS